jgi:hypothetical protein
LYADVTLEDMRAANDVLPVIHAPAKSGRKTRPRKSETLAA